MKVTQRVETCEVEQA
jgi:hypothetical protein